MAEPARKLEDDNQKDQPFLRAIPGGGQTTGDRANLKLLNEQESNPEQQNTGSIDEQESNGSNVIQGPWKTNVSNDKTGSSKSGGRFSFVKKKGPMTAIILTLVGGGIGIGGLLSPALLIVQMKEVMVNKFNSQLASMDVRTTKLLSKKMGTTSGLCNSAVTVACKYSTMSEKQITNFKNAGIDVIADEKTTIFGRTKPKSFTFDGKTIDAKNFSTELTKNPEFRSALKVAYNPKLAGFSDSIWERAANRLGISKKASNISGETDEARLKSIQEDVSSGSNKAKKVSAGEINPETGKNYTAGEVDAINKVVDETEAIAKQEVKTATAVLEDVESGIGLNMSSVSHVLNIVKITGTVDAACQVYRGVEAVGFAAKTVRALQLARFAMLFLNVADQIKAGDAKPEDVSYLGKILTSTNSEGKAATDSFGYKYSAYGESGQMSTVASQYLAGGGLAGKLIGITALIESTISNKTGGSLKSTCNFLSNPFVSFGSLIIGIGLFLVPGVNVAITAKDIASAIPQALLYVAAMALPSMLKDVVAGVLVDKNTVGEAAGDAYTSGASGMMGDVAKTGGNAPLTPAQAVAYNDLSNNIAQQYNQDNQTAYNQFDATNSSTFMGIIASKLTPYISKASSMTGVLSSIMSIASGSMSSIFSPITKASDTINNYTMCQDYEYRELGLATDPYCNITYGIPVDALNADPITVSDTLLNQIDPEDGISPFPQIDSQTGDPISAYSNFVNECINNSEPLTKTSDEITTGDKCLFGNKFLLKEWYTYDTLGVPIRHRAFINNNNFYIHYIDQRANKGMEGI